MFFFLLHIQVTGTTGGACIPRSRIDKSAGLAREFSWIARRQKSPVYTQTKIVCVRASAYHSSQTSDRSSNASYDDAKNQLIGANSSSIRTVRPEALAFNTARLYGDAFSLPTSQRRIQRRWTPHRTGIAHGLRAWRAALRLLRTSRRWCLEH